jgi:hypothetical protein
MEVEVTTTEKKTLISKGYEFLRELSSFKADFNSFTKNLNPITNRVQYIMNRLDAHNIAYTIDKYQSIHGVPDFVEGLPAEVNIVVEIEGNNKDLTTVFTAHHDVMNLDSESVQDNTASVCNLLDLCVRLSKNKPANNVVICFNDSEEAVKPLLSGIQRVVQNILQGKYGQVKYAVVLELTANGKNYWMSYNKSNNNQLATHIREIHPTVRRVRTPYNDSAVIESSSNISSVCIGSLSDGDMNNVITRGFCRTWGLCHSLNDKFENANEGDMDLFVNFLETLI